MDSYYSSADVGHRGFQRSLYIDSDVAVLREIDDLASPFDQLRAGHPILVVNETNWPRTGYDDGPMKDGGLKP